MKTLKEIRIDRDLSLKEVANKAGLSVYKVKQIEGKEFKKVAVVDFIKLLMFYEVKSSEVNLGSI